MQGLAALGRQALHDFPCAPQPTASSSSSVDLRRGKVIQVSDPSQPGTTPQPSSPGLGRPPSPNPANVPPPGTGTPPPQPSSPAGTVGAAHPGPSQATPAPPPSPVHHGRVGGTRVSAVWVGLIAAAVFLILLIIFIAQNLTKVSIHFLGFNGHMSLGLTILIAAVIGLLIAAVPGSIRIMQLRRTVRRMRRTSKQSAAQRPAA